jgi:hypothetical protein
VMTSCPRFRRGWSGGAREFRDETRYGGRQRGGEPGRARCRRWIGPPRTCPKDGSENPGRSPRRPAASSSGCRPAWTAAARTAVWPDATARSPRTATRRPWAAWSARPRTLRRGVRSGVVRAVQVGWYRPEEWTGCRSARSAWRRGSPSCVACTGCCRTRTLFRCSLHCLAPKTCLTMRLTGFPQNSPATGQGRIYPPGPAGNRPDIVGVRQRLRHSRCAGHNDNLRPDQLRPKSWTQLPGPRSDLTRPGSYPTPIEVNLQFRMFLR